MFVLVSIDLVENECRHVLGNVVPESAINVWCEIRVKVGGTEPTGHVQIYWLGCKKDGTRNSRRTGRGLSLTPAWWKALVVDNTRLPYAYRRAIDSLVTTQVVENAVDAFNARAAKVASRTRPASEGHDANPSS